MDFDFNAANWRKNIQNEAALIEALAVRFEEALPANTKVVREKSFFAKEARVTKIEIYFNPETYIVNYHKKNGMVAEKSKTVRGITLKTEVMEFGKWMEELAKELEKYAKENGETKRALEKFLLSD